MKHFALGILFSVTGLAWSQAQLSKPKAVAVGVTNITWETAAKALAYDFEDADGKGQGLYNLGNSKGKPVFRFGSKVLTQQVWLNGRPVLIESFDEPVTGRDTVRTSIWALDSVNLTAKELYGMEHKKDESPDISIMVSPSRPHAIVDITVEKKRLSYVITEGQNGMIFSSDLTKANENNVGFLGWSVDGTAYYSDNAHSIPISINGGTTEIFANPQSQNAQVEVKELPVTFSVELTKLAIDTSNATVSFRAARMFTRPIKPGETVFELMPGNGSLRQVKARGSYVDPVQNLLALSTESSVAKLTYGTGTGESNPLWLVKHSPAEAQKLNKNVPKPEAVLIASQATNGWLADNQQAVAYLTDGALFIRNITWK